jgi:hypothetical protein
MKIVKSVRGVPIRLTTERLQHIERRHPEMLSEEERILEVVASADYVQEGDGTTLIAVKHYPKTPLTEKYCAVVYRELGEGDGCVVTAYLPASPRKGGRPYGSRKAVRQEEGSRRLGI